jgi:hypothetical protein
MNKEGSVLFECINIFFLFIFLSEFFIKFFGLGWQYFKSAFNVFDCVLIWLSVFGELRSESSSHFTFLSNLTILRLLRLIRLVRSLKRFKPIFKTLLTLTPALRSLFMIVFSVFYAFSVVGYELFAGVIDCDTDDHVMFESEFCKLNYQRNNFDNFVQSMVVMWELTIVNNWHVIMHGFVQATDNRLTRLYFIAFYFVSVCIVMNVVVAFILESFIAQYGRLTEQEKKEMLRAEELKKRLKKRGNWKTYKANLRKLQERVTGGKSNAIYSGDSGSGESGDEDNGDGDVVTLDFGGNDSFRKSFISDMKGALAFGRLRGVCLRI